MIFFEGLMTPRAQVAVDDAGIRCFWPKQASPAAAYVPFAQLADATLEFTMFRVPLLRLVRRDGGTTTVRIARGDALDVQADVLHHIASNPPSEPPLPAGTVGALGRAGRPLAAWLAAVAAWASSGSGYRSAALDREAANATLLDVRLPIDVRAACAHAMLSTGDEEELTAVARAFTVRALPPLVVVAARLGRGGAALVPDSMWDEAASLLPTADSADAAAARAAAARDTNETDAHVREVMARVREAAIREALERRKDDTARWRLKKHMAHPLLSFAASQGVTRFK